MKIKITTGWNDFSNTKRTKEIPVVDAVPEVGDEYGGGTVTKVWNDGCVLDTHDSSKTYTHYILTVCMGDWDEERHVATEDGMDEEEFA